jgi:hypothetical protein
MDKEERYGDLAGKFMFSRADTIATSAKIADMERVAVVMDKLQKVLVDDGCSRATGLVALLGLSEMAIAQVFDQYEGKDND